MIYIDWGGITILLSQPIQIYIGIPVLLGQQHLYVYDMVYV